MTPGPPTSWARRPCRRWRRSRCGGRCSRAGTHPAHPTRPERRSDGRGPGHGPGDRRLCAAGDLLDLLTATLLATRAPVLSARPCTPRCGSTRLWPRTSPPSAAAASISSSRLPAAWPGETRRRPAGRPGRHRRRRRRPSAGSAGSATLAGVTAVSRHRRGHPRADRPGPFHRQPVVGQAGLRHRRRAGRRGRRVSLMSTVSRPAPAGVEVVAVETAAEMEEAVAVARRRRHSSSWPRRWPTSGPRRPGASQDQEGRRPPDGHARTDPDILAGLGARRRPGQMIVGFAAETVTLGRSADSRELRPRQARRQGRRPHRGQRRRRPRGRVRPSLCIGSGKSLNTTASSFPYSFSSCCMRGFIFAQ